MDKAGPLPSGRVVLSRALRRYYEPLRLPQRPAATSALTLYAPVGGSAPPPSWISRTALLFFRHMPPLLPREIRWNASVFPSHRQRPSPSDHRVGISSLVTRLPVGSLALRPATLPQGNSQPPIARTLLPGARKVYGQLLSRDLNPLEKQPVTAYGQVSPVSMRPPLDRVIVCAVAPAFKHVRSLANAGQVTGEGRQPSPDKARLVQTYIGAPRLKVASLGSACRRQTNQPLSG